MYFVYISILLILQNKFMEIQLFKKEISHAKFALTKIFNTY